MKPSIIINILILLSISVSAQNVKSIAGVENPARIGGVRIDSVRSLSGIVKDMTVTDIDGNVYKTVKIGNQIWMAENLKVTHYPNGDTIPYVTDETTWAYLVSNNIPDAYCYYNNNSNGEADIYGALYSYAAAIAVNWGKDNKDGQGVCPDGWHLPADTEWMILEEEVESTTGVNWEVRGGRGTDAGGNLKETGTTHWLSPNTGATNSSGFSALPGGYRAYNGTFAGMHEVIFWWSATRSTDKDVYMRFLSYNYAHVSRYDYNEANGFYIRCVKD